MLRGRKAKRASDAKAPARAGDARRKTLAAARAAFPSPGQGPPVRGSPEGTPRLRHRRCQACRREGESAEQKRHLIVGACKGSGSAAGLTRALAPPSLARALAAPVRREQSF